MPPSYLPFHPALALGGQSLDHIAVFPAVWILVWVCKRKTPTGDKGTGGESGSVKVVTNSFAMAVCASPKEVTFSVQRPTSTPFSGKQTTPKG